MLNTSTTTTTRISLQYFDWYGRVNPNLFSNLVIFRNAYLIDESNLSVTTGTKNFIKEKVVSHW